VVLVDLTEHTDVANKTIERLRIVQPSSKAIFVACDVSKEKQVEALMSTVSERFGRIDVVFCNAGIPGSCKIFLDFYDPVNHACFDCSF
jgi:NAD(P)-dependent dehydrogenase (short-subunit alcohol dehydrogenase family)